MSAAPGAVRGGRRVAVCTSSWDRPHVEESFVTRCLAGALSRVATTDVYVPGVPGPPVADGAFDVTAVGSPDAGPGGGGGWPAPGQPGAVRLAADLVVAPLADVAAVGALAHSLWGRPALAAIVAGGADGTAAPVADGSLAVGMPAVAGGATPELCVGLHVPVNNLAATRRHVGMAFTGYTLVLSDRAAGAGRAEDGRRSDMISPLAGWVVARFPRRVVIVVEDALASIWRSRSLLGTVAVDSRMDLWRIVAHAAMTVDLAPGPLVARECVESLRFGVPVVVPAASTAQRLASAGGGLWYRDVAELLGCVDALGDPSLARALGAQGRAAADDWYGDATAFVARVAAALDALAPA